jgi:ADP-heptose:LPS heptosyltransferase
MLKEFKDHLVFIGLPNEYELFKSKYFDLEYCPTKDLLEAAQYIAGAKGVIGNQSGLFSLTECIKVPRILLTAEYFKYKDNFYPGPVNVHPQGGWNEVAAITEKLKTAVKTLLT